MKTDIRFMIKEAAQDYIRSGLSVIPVLLKDKRPVIQWKAYQSKIPTQELLDIWWAQNDYAVALIAGKVSGGIEFIDVDNHDGTASEIFESFKELVVNTEPGLFDKLVIQKTQSGGYHIVYRCSVIEGNLKLAKRWKNEKEQDTIIETRGEGGYALISPSPGYELLQGTFTNVQLISPEDRELLLSISRSFNEVEDVNQNRTPEHTEFIQSERPGDAFNKRGDIANELKDVGWTLVKCQGNKELWRRPGKEKGISATFNFIKDKFYCFTSNGHPFEMGKAYDKFAVHTILYYNGDFKESAKELLRHGYGSMNGKGKGISGVKSNPNKPTLFPSDDIFKALNLPENCVFWYETTKGVREPIQCLNINKTNFINYLEYNGYYKYWIDTNLSIYIRIQQNIVSEETPETIIDFVKRAVYNMPEKISNNFTNLQLWENIVQKIHIFKSNDFLATLTPKHLNLVRDTKDTAFFFFRNKCIKVIKDNAIEVDYKDLKGHIWKEQIIKHDLKLLPLEEAGDTSNCVFGRFLEHVCSPHNSEFPEDRSKRIVDTKRLSSLCSAIGYLLHTYKNPALTKAIIFCEEKIAQNEEANGRTGKGLTYHGIIKLRKHVFFNGKQVDFKDKFYFQKISPDTQLLIFDDVKKGFDFESLFSILTEGITVERKGMKPFEIPFDQSPKILITTNHVLSNETDSHRARKHEIEFSDYYTADFTPVDDFGGNILDKGWVPDDPEWDRFYSFMIYITLHYLANDLVDYQQVNLAERKMIANVNGDFLEFIMDEYPDEELTPGLKIFKDDIYNKFTSKYEIYGPHGHYAKSQTMTSKWMKMYLVYKKVNFKESRNSTRDDRKKYFVLGGDANEGMF
ncbi:MAG: bifunctional DNA primase/polymerase [Bacteroidetes bacterium]|nr:bifunctional DNA primase/polymerase [Bacteroidota bacterium]